MVAPASASSLSERQNVKQSVLSSPDGWFACPCRTASALLTLRDDEPSRCRPLVEQALEHPQRCYACFLSRMDSALPRSGKTKTSAPCRLAYEQLKPPPLQWIAAAAMQVGATLASPKIPSFVPLPIYPRHGSVLIQQLDRYLTPPGAYGYCAPLGPK